MRCMTWRAITARPYHKDKDYFVGDTKLPAQLPPTPKSGGNKSGGKSGGGATGKKGKDGRPITARSLKVGRCTCRLGCSVLAAAATSTPLCRFE